MVWVHHLLISPFIVLTHSTTLRSSTPCVFTSIWVPCYGIHIFFFISFSIGMCASYDIYSLSTMFVWGTHTQQHHHHTRRIYHFQLFAYFLFSSFAIASTKAACLSVRLRVRVCSIPFVSGMTMVVMENVRISRCGVAILVLLLSLLLFFRDNALRIFPLAIWSNMC